MYEGRYQGSRPDLRAWMRHLPAPYLEIGCGSGATLAELLREGRVNGQTIGVEMDTDAAAAARRIFDEVHVGAVEEVVDRLPSVGTLVLADVLEHLADPWQMLRQLAGRLEQGGVVYASIPNVGYYAVSWPLFWHGRFTYADTGILDRTHLRFFDRQSMTAMFEQAGLRILRMEGAMGERTRWLNRYTFGRFEHWLAGQYFIEAVRR